MRIHLITVGHRTPRIRTMKCVMKCAHLTEIASVAVLAAIVWCVVSCAHTNQSAATNVTFETIRVQLPAGAAYVDVYRPDTATQAPMVIIAHGFSRHRDNMSGWGQHLAKEGFVAVVPDLPTQSDHVRNGRFISDLRAYFCVGESWKERINPTRVGLMGFSAGGLSSLLSAADFPDLAIWVGLDPVDRDGMGLKAAPTVQCHAVVLTAEPSACNAHGNARGIIAALPQHEHFSIPGAVHMDAEWPTSWMAELICGRSSDEKRAEFRERATKALHEALVVPPLNEGRSDVR
jgi:dienelactone hydrolase